jgi:hypothetical protein
MARDERGRLDHLGINEDMWTVLSLPVMAVICHIMDQSSTGSAFAKACARGGGAMGEGTKGLRAGRIKHGKYYHCTLSFDIICELG